MTLDHLGIAATDASRALFSRLLGAEPYKTETVEAQGVRTVFYGGGTRAAPKLELLEATRDDSPVARFLASRGPGLHHLAFEVADLEGEMARVRNLGIRLLSDAPQAGADGKRIVFLHPKDTAGVLVELCQSTRRRETVRLPHREGFLAVHVSGEEGAPPLVVLHGALGSTALETDRLVQFWERDFEVFALDFSGHGESTASAELPTWSTYVDDVLVVLDRAELREASLFGFSMGGGVALAAARRRRYVRRVAVHATHVQWQQSHVSRMVRPMRAARQDASGRWAARLAETHGDRWRDLVSTMALFTERLPTDWIDDAALREVTQPTLVSAGDADRYFEVDHALHLSRTLPDARLWVLPDLDHPIQGVDAESFAATVARHLAL